MYLPGIIDVTQIGVTQFQTKLENYQRHHIVAKFMVIENFRPGTLDEVYKRFYEKGRMLPEGLSCIDSWLENKGHRCFQLMETSDQSLFSEWMKNWDDLAEFEIIEIGERPEPE